MNNEPTVKDMFIALLSILPQVIEHYKNNANYKPILTYLKENDFYNNEDVRYPTFKILEEATGIKTYKLRKYIKEMYINLLGYEDAFPMDFNNVEVYIYAQFAKNNVTVKCKNLKQLPRIGEEVEFMFLKAQVGTSYFYVKKVTHSFENDQQVITIWLKGGFYNSYYRFRLDEALAKGEINSRELYELHSFEINERLGLPRYV